MYTAFYGLRDKPFSLTPDPRFLFLSGSHREALAHLLFGIDQGEGFIAVTGEVGTGKTTICRTLIERLGSDTEVAFVFNPNLDARELLEAISLELELPVEGRSRRELGDQLNRFLLAKRHEGRRVLLIVDEAQNLSRDALEEIRLLSNLETPTEKLLQILLLGQPELDEQLESHELRQLRQRISVRWRLSPLAAPETAAYVQHRLRIAAQADRSRVFSDRALREIHRRSGGVPRVINVLCERSMLAGYAAGATSIGPELVEAAARELFGEGGSAVGAEPVRRRRWAGLLPAALTALAAAALVAVGYAIANLRAAEPPRDAAASAPGVAPAPNPVPTAVPTAAPTAVPAPALAPGDGPAPDELADDALAADPLGQAVPPAAAARGESEGEGPG